MRIPILQLDQNDHHPLEPFKQDEIEDCLDPLESLDTHVEKKIIPVEIIPSATNFEKFLHILSRVYRNIDMINNEELIDKIFDYIIESFCYLGFSIIDEMQEEKHSLTDQNYINSVETLLELIANFIPLIIQVKLFDGIAHSNLERIIYKKIDLYKNNEKKNQYELFLLYLLLIDLDVYQNLNIFDELIESVHLDILKSGILLKLYSYLMFKSYQRPNFERNVRKRIQNLTKILNKKVDIASLQRALERKRKKLLLRK